jgi:hypothetical protein
MLMSIVVQPEAFASGHFESPGYRDQAEMMLRGMQSNGVLLVDSDRALLRALRDQIEALGTKCGQQIKVRFEELQKSGRSRVVVTQCRFNPSMPSYEASRMVYESVHADALVVDPVAGQQLRVGIGADPQGLTPMGSYISSVCETTRHAYLEGLPSLDKMGGEVFSDHIARVARFSKRLRFYDKQIGTGNNLPGFRRGIGKILSLWAANAYYGKSALTAEIYTCVQLSGPKAALPPEVAYSRIKDDLVVRLADTAGLPIKFFFKNDPGQLTHDRFLQTDSLAVYFSKGFDFLDQDESLHRCSMRVDNTAYDNLREYRQFGDHIEPFAWQPRLRR